MFRTTKATRVHCWFVTGLLCLFGMAVSAHAQVIRFVNHNATGTPATGLTWSTAYRNLRDALDFAHTPGGAGVTDIWVASANQYRYKPDETASTPLGSGDPFVSFQLRSSLSVLGGFVGGETSSGQRNPAVNVTNLSGDLSENDGPAAFQNNGENSKHVVRADDTNPTALLDGFTVKGGNANLAGDDGLGGGIFMGTYADFAGIFPGNATIRGCRFEGNSAMSAGGGLQSTFAQNLEVRNCVFVGNRAFSVSLAGGGGIEISGGSWKLINSTFTANQASLGGGVKTDRAASVKMINCRFFGNSASPSTDGRGGAMVVEFNGASTSFTNCLFSGNTATNVGGAVYVTRGGGAAPFVNCTFSRNTAVNFGGGIKVDISGFGAPILALKNCVLFHNSDITGMTFSAQVTTPLASDLTLNHTCFQGLPLSFDVQGNAGFDPLFVDDDGPNGIVGTDDDNLRLQNCSPVRNRGLNGSVPADTENVNEDSGPTSLTEPTPDLDLLNRIVGSAVDMGAYENREICLADLNGDCRINSLDLGILLAAWSIPGTALGCQGAIPCCADLNGDGFVNSLDLGILLAAWTDLDPPLPSCAMPCGGGSMMMGGGGGPSAMGLAGPSIAGLAQPVVDPPTLDPDLLMWLMTAEIEDLLAWYEAMTGGSSGSDE